MKFKLLLFTTFIISISNFVNAQDQTFKLKDGTIIVGFIKQETESDIEVQTKFGIVTINKSELILTEYIVKLQSGETLVGIKMEEDSETIKLKTQMGVLTIQKSDILNIQEAGEQTGVGDNTSPDTYHRPYFSLADFLFSGKRVDKDTDFALGEEQLIDLFFDPTGYTLERSTLYLSGLSFGFGVTDKFQITTKWGGFFWGNMNLRAKFKLFESGNWENQRALSVGAHYHTRWNPNKYEWKSGSKTSSNGEKYWGGYYKIGEDPQYTLSSDNNYLNRADNIYEEYIEMIELFGAYTFSTARPNLKGRISHTVGGNLQYIMTDNPTAIYRAYYGLDVDINRKLKMIGELFYDPYFLELWQQFQYESDYFSDEQVSQPDYRPFHIDFGFIYALNESFRFGLHFQRPFVAFYWKL